MLRAFMQQVPVRDIQIRTLTNHKHNKKFIFKGEGVSKEKITKYYPRDPDFQDPPIEAAKMFRVERIKPVKGNPYWERRILRDLGLIEKGKYFTIVKNIPENNSRLWKIKHLIHITPITFPYGEPTKDDINYTFVKENGECIVTKEIKVDETRVQASEAFQQDPVRLDRETIKKDLRAKWLNAWDWKP